MEGGAGPRSPGTGRRVGGRGLGGGASADSWPPPPRETRGCCGLRTPRGTREKLASLRSFCASPRHSVESEPPPPPPTPEERRKASPSQVGFTLETTDGGGETRGYAFPRHSHPRSGSYWGRELPPCPGRLERSSPQNCPLTLTLCGALPSLLPGHGSHGHVLTCGTLAWIVLHLL